MFCQNFKIKEHPKGNYYFSDFRIINSFFSNFLTLAIIERILDLVPKYPFL